jgi:methyl-accepting chemotaxis protein
MTQEELDALLNGGGDISEIDDNDATNGSDELPDEFADIVNEVSSDSEDTSSVENKDDIFPPPADDKHKVVAQLDEVTKESEEKASQVLEIISEISEDVGVLTDKLSDVKAFLEKEKEIFIKLHTKFPHIKTFENQIKEIEEKMQEIEEVLKNAEEMDTKLFTALEIMQYQDIHRQKIERVINIMRALIKYMNKLFEGKVADEERVKSADYIHGDTDEALSEDEIEKLLQEFGG